MLFRLAASTLASQVRKGAQIAIGAGLPEEIARVFFECGRLRDVTFLVESGAVGGLPGSGAFFGAAFSPREIVSVAQLFARARRRLDAACLAGRTRSRPDRAVVWLPGRSLEASRSEEKE